MFQRSELKEGMTVRSSDGEKLGRVFALGEGEFHIEKGLFFPKDYLVRYSDIVDIRDGEIILAHGRDSLRQLSSETAHGTADTLGTSAGLGMGATTGVGMDMPNTGTSASASTSVPPGRPLEGRTETEGVAIPIHKEELDVTKREVQTGEVRIHKDVVEEEKTVSVPVRKERVRVERRDITPDRPAMNASFNEETVVVPVYSEEVDVQKRAVQDEEVVIRKDAIDEERRVAESVRREDVDIRTSGDADDSRSLDLTPDDPTVRRR
jgi:uncharacterized protein (TIGR02271 family)